MTLFDPDAAAGDRAGVAGVAPTTTAEAVPPEDGHAETRSGSGAPAVTTRLRLGVAYRGAGFRGFAAQPGQRTVGGELARAIAVVTRHPVELVCAGRTDAGVHAAGQVVHVDVDPGTDPARLLRSVNAMLGPDVVVHSAETAPAGFDARRSATARRYRYLVLEAPRPDPLLAPLTWQVAGPLDLRAMRSAADGLLGEHDFRAFCRRAPGTAPGTPIVRRVLDARVAEVTTTPGDLDPAARLLRFDVEASSFCHQMVRSVVGVLVEVGRGRHRVSDVTWLLRSGDRSRGGNVIAPPQGLCLTAVRYGPGPR